MGASAPEVVTTTSRWILAPADLTLPDAEVHIWRTRLDSPTTNLSALMQILSPDERQRAERLLRLHDRVYFVAGRGVLREILARYLRVKPAHLRFEYGALGKPHLAPEWEAAGLCFNLSHAGGLALYAVTRRREVGVDVERVRDDICVRAVIAGFCAPQEETVIQSLPAEMRRASLFACWSRREAFLKALGCGLTAPSDQCAVVRRPGQPPALPCDGNSHEPAHWKVMDLDVGAGYVAALAAEGHDWRLRTFLLSGVER
jgi:4'-phosphopantetheinyl transferase